MARPQQQDTTQLLQAATQLFWRQGYAATGTREIEQALGIKSPAIYHRFGSKQKLFCESLRHYIATVIDWRIQHYLDAENALWGLRVFFESIPENAARFQQPSSCLLVNTSIERASADEEIQACLQEGTHKILMALRRNLLRLKAQDSLAPDTNIDQLASNLQLQLFGLLVSSRLPDKHQNLAEKTKHIIANLPITAKFGEL
jgi:TetR/AcrR family transcriptional repressor of nem operon